MRLIDLRLRFGRPDDLASIAIGDSRVDDVTGAFDMAASKWVAARRYEIGISISAIRSRIWFVGAG